MTATPVPKLLLNGPKLIDAASYELPTDPRVKLVLAGKHTHFTIDGHTVPGVHDVLKKTIWPNYQYEEAKFNETNQHATASTMTQWKPRSGTMDAATRGKRKGVQADNVLMQSLTLKRKHLLSDTLFAANRQRKRVKLDQCETWLKAHSSASVLIGEQRLLMKLLNALIPDLRLMWSIFVKYRLRPVACQYMCCVPGLFATAVDCVVLDQQNSIILIELKKGGQNYLYKHTRTPLCAPFQDHNDCIKHQWLIQLGLTLYAFLCSSPTLTSQVGTPKLLRINENPEASELFDLPAWISDRLDSLVAVLRTAADESKRRRALGKTGRGGGGGGATKGGGGGAGVHIGESQA